ncbi:hypothetical protein [Rufibacter roseolus]|uniref:hypothetical protein n=1 Tax=Rufibacter roseolus TaxID=2817375 RepID=UPI001B300731|nr:hypothetical protein [Rufibacter roseolus]
MRLNICQEGQDYCFYKNDEEEPYLNARVGWVPSNKAIASIYKFWDKPVAIIRQGKGQKFWEKGKVTYLLQLMEGTVEVIIESAWKGHWSFDYKGFQYNFYMHNGYKKSLFKAGEQVAKFDAREYYPLPLKKAFIVANNDEDDILLLSLFLLYDKESALDSELPRNSAFLGRGVRESDQYWFPKR